jgi:hypothetical protein
MHVAEAGRFCEDEFRSYKELMVALDSGDLEKVRDVEMYLDRHNIPSPKELDSQVWKRNYGNSEDKNFMKRIDERHRQDEIMFEMQRQEQATFTYQFNQCLDSKTFSLCWKVLLVCMHVAIIIVCFVFGINYKGCGCVNWAWLGPGVALVAIPGVVGLYLLLCICLYICAGKGPG